LRVDFSSFRLRYRRVCLQDSVLRSDIIDSSYDITLHNVLPFMDRDAYYSSGNLGSYGKIPARRSGNSPTQGDCFIRRSSSYTDAVHSNGWCRGVSRFRLAAA
jgi:hypothetical protein